jgi:cell division protein FtsQ
MIKRIINIVIWLVLIAWFTVIMGFVRENNADLLCKQIVISISDSTDIKFVTADMVRELIQNSGITTQGYPLEGIRTRDLEQMMEKDPYVANAEVFVNVEGDLLVEIDQRKPLLRVMPGGKSGYFIDHEGVILPLSKNYSPMVLLVTGNIKIQEVPDSNGMLMADIEEDADLQKLMDFAGYVEKHEFWSTQIVQLYRAGNGDFELIPRIGAHQIQFGKLDDFEVKLRNLKLLYNQGLKKYGWNNYDKINLKYSNQIICTKR